MRTIRESKHGVVAADTFRDRKGSEIPSAGECVWRSTAHHHCQTEMSVADLSGMSRSRRGRLTGR